MSKTMLIEIDYADGVDTKVLANEVTSWLESLPSIRRVEVETRSEEKIRLAERILRRDYWADIRAFAQELKQKLDSEELDDVDSAYQWLFETVDSCSWTFQTWLSLKCLLFSDNTWAYYENSGEEEINVCKVAHYAFERDLQDQIIAELGDDVTSYLKELEFRKGLEE